MSDIGVPQAQGPGGKRALLLVWKTFPQTQGNEDCLEAVKLLLLTPVLANSLATVYEKPVLLKVKENQ